MVTKRLAERAGGVHSPRVPPLPAVASTMDPPSALPPEPPPPAPPVFVPPVPAFVPPVPAFVPPVPAFVPPVPAMPPVPGPPWPPEALGLLVEVHAATRPASERIDTRDETERKAKLLPI